MKIGMTLAAAVLATALTAACSAEPAAAPSDSTAAPSVAATTPASSPEGTPLQTQLRSTCEAGAAFDKALTAFIDSGPSADVAAQLDPARASFIALQKQLEAESGAGVDDLTQAVSDYLVAIDSLTVLYTKGETVYQQEKAAGRDADKLRASGAELWTKGVAALFDSQPPSAPDDFMRTC